MPRVDQPGQHDLFGSKAPDHAAPNEGQAVKSELTCAMCRETYLSDHEVARRFGVSRAAIWRWVANVPGFPKPIKLTPGTTRWKLSDLVRFEAMRTQAAGREAAGKSGGGAS